MTDNKKLIEWANDCRDEHGEQQPQPDVRKMTWEERKDILRKQQPQPDELRKGFVDSPDLQERKPQPDEELPGWTREFREGFIKSQAEHQPQPDELVEKILNIGINLRWKESSSATDEAKAEIRKLLPPKPSVTITEREVRRVANRMQKNITDVWILRDWLKSKGFNVKGEK